MKQFILWIPLAFVVGGFVGAWGPVEELRAYKARPAAAPAAEKKTRQFDAFAQMIRLPATARRRRAAGGAGSVSNRADRVVAADANVTTASVEKTAMRASGPERAPHLDPEDLRARIEEAAELWRTRSELVRANAVKKLGLDAQGAARFDEALARMNDELRASIQTIADALAEAGELTPALGVRLMGDLSATVADTYDQIGACVEASQRGEVSNLELVELVDPAVAEPLIAVQGKLQESFSRRRTR
jgi:hypothetical protein